MAAFKQIVVDNHGNNVEVWCGLKKGDKVRCKKTSRGLLDVGMSGMVLDYDDFVEGRLYEVGHVSNGWGVKGGVPYILDEDNCSRWPTTRQFELVEEDGD